MIEGVVNPVPALGGAASEGPVRLSELPPRTMISLKGDLSSAKIKNVATGIAAVDFPEAGGANCVGEKGILWMAHDELLIMCPRAEQSDAMAKAQTTLAGSHFLAADVSDARSVFLLEGEGAFVREVLAKLTPADLHPDRFAPGQFRRTRLAQVAAGFWLRDETAAEVIAFRSNARYVFSLLENAVAGGRVGHF